jgi:F420-0:gamma-glutamyl ligase-like protein
MDKTTVSINGHLFERIPVKTHLILFGENLLSIIQKYVVPKFKNGDWVAISEKVVSVCQNNARHISTVKAGLLAKILVKGVKNIQRI